eukprot:gene17530-20919_t
MEQTESEITETTVTTTTVETTTQDHQNGNNKRVANGDAGTPLKKKKGEDDDTTAANGAYKETPTPANAKPIPNLPPLPSGSPTTTTTTTTTTTSTSGISSPVKSITTPPSAMAIPASIVSKTPTTTATSISKTTTITPTGVMEGIPAPAAAAVAPTAQVILQQPAPPGVSVLLASSYIPHQCAWFKMNEIHDIERMQMSEFFNGKSPSKTPEIYKEYRDFMINTYQQNTYQYLTLTAVRRNLVGDVCAIMRVHAFLDHWGLINYFVNPDGGACIPAPAPPKEEPPAKTDIMSPKEGLTSPGLMSPKEETAKSKQVPASSSLDLRNNIYGQPQAPPKTVCSNCGIDCSALRYHLNKKTLVVPEVPTNLPPDLYKVNLCSACYTNANYAPGHQAADFTKIEQEVSLDPPEEWTDQETLLLLEGIDIFGDSWLDVAEHVGTKSKEQCLLHFLRLPIEDSYLEDNFSKAWALKSNTMNPSKESGM